MALQNIWLHWFVLHSPELEGKQKVESILQNLCFVNYCLFDLLRWETEHEMIYSNLILCIVEKDPNIQKILNLMHFCQGAIIFLHWKSTWLISMIFQSSSKHSCHNSLGKARKVFETMKSKHNNQILSPRLSGKDILGKQLQSLYFNMSFCHLAISSKVLTINIRFFLSADRRK